MTMPRRLFLSAPALLAAGAAQARQSATATAAAAAAAASGLHRRAMTHDRFYGAAIDYRVLRTDHAYMAAVPAECGIITAESAFKWSDLRPAPNKFAFTHADQTLAYASHHNLQVRGHTLLWHENNPNWLRAALTPVTGERLLRTHIHTVCHHYRRRLTHWDVVNEVLWPQDRLPHGLRDSLWYRALGPRMLDIAFHACAEADPGALRFINDFGMEYTWKDNQAKREAMLKLLSDLTARGVPVQGVGIQAHLEAGVEPGTLDQTVLAKFCDNIASMGLKIVITELDIRDNRLPAALEARDEAVAAHGKAFLDAMLASPAVLGVVTWGLSDRRTWLNDDEPRKDGLPQRPLPLDTELRRKRLWAAMAQCFDNAPKPG